jgi:flavin-dependent dehydrogenase
MHDLIVIGGGPAGTAAAITAARLGARVLLLERGRFPRHKVCGEFVSAESIGLLADLLAHSAAGRLLTAAPRMAQTRIFIGVSKVQAPVQPPAASITRYVLDAALWQAAEEAGVECSQQVGGHAIEGAGPFTVASAEGEFRTSCVVDASGRWSKLGNALEPAPDKCIGLKRHFAASQEAGSTDLYFFPGGYCGVQPVAPGVVNACAMVRSEVAASLDQVFALHPALRERSREWQPVMREIATSPLVFRAPVCESEGVLRAGDAAGFIDPFVGDGISLALRTGALAAQCLAEVWRGVVPARVATGRYRAAYEAKFMPVFQNAARLRRLLQWPALLQVSVLQLLRAPVVARYVLRKTRWH